MVEENLSDMADLNIVTRDNGEYKWITFTPDINLNDFEKLHSGGSSDSYILRSTLDPKVHMGVKRGDLFQSLLSKCAMEMVSTARAYVAKLEHTPAALSPAAPADDRVKGIPAIIDPKRPPKNFKDAMSREDRQEWAVAYDNEYQGF